MATIKIMTFNLRTISTSDGINNFPNRCPLILERLPEYSPDVIGFQEIQPPMYEWLVANLPDYYIVGGGRGAKRDNEAVCIAFKKDKFTLCDCETFWLSATPDIPGTRYSGDQSVCPRICTQVTLKPKDGDPFRVYNVHTDHVGHVARVLAANQVLQKISSDNGRSKMKLFVTGDFNAEPDDLCITTMINYGGTPIVDLTKDVGLTYHAYGSCFEENHKIDYIFADADTKCVSCVKLTDVKDGVYLSDHYPVMATVEL